MPDSSPVAVSFEQQLRRATERVGQTVCDKWRLDALLGVGGMAAVYAATHRNGKRVALKILHPELSGYPDARERFIEEGYAANRVGHPGVVSVLDDGMTEDGSAFLVMDLLEGETADARLQRSGGRLEPVEALTIADQLLDVLTAAHAVGVIHRDIKPENVFITRDGEVKLLDFGIARMTESRRTTRTQFGATMGTPAFMAPEQARGRLEDIDARTDLWALGATLFLLLTGRLVHQADTANEELLAAMTRPAPKLGTVADDIPPAVAELVDTALAYEREQRFADAQAMQRSVRAAYAAIGGPGELPPTLPPTPFAPTLPSVSPSAPGPTTYQPVATSDGSSVGRNVRRHGWIGLVGLAAGALAVTILAMFDATPGAEPPHRTAGASAVPVEPPILPPEDPRWTRPPPLRSAAVAPFGSKQRAPSAAEASTASAPSPAPGKQKRALEPAQRLAAPRPQVLSPTAVSTPPAPPASASASTPTPAASKVAPFDPLSRRK